MNSDPVQIVRFDGPPNEAAVRKLWRRSFGKLGEEAVSPLDFTRIDWSRSHGALCGSDLVGTLVAKSVKVSLGGMVAPFVDADWMRMTAVDPRLRGTGIMVELMRAQLSLAADGGASIAVGWETTPGLYTDIGWGPVAESISLGEVDLKDICRRSPKRNSSAGATLVELDCPSGRREGATIMSDVIEHRAGQSPGIWQRLADEGERLILAQGGGFLIVAERSYLWCIDRGAQLEVLEIVCSTGDAEHELLTLLDRLAFARSVTLGGIASDDFILDHVRSSTEWRRDTMIGFLIDPVRALQARTYVGAPNGSLAFVVQGRDEQPETLVRLTTSNGRASVETIKKVELEPEGWISRSALASLVFGYEPSRTAFSSGVVGTDNFRGRISAAFRSIRAPFSPIGAA